MKAVVQTKYGPPEVLRIGEMENPVPKDNEVLIRIYATTVTAVDCTFRKGSPLIGRLFTGLTKPKKPVPGTELAGVIEAVGKDVTLFKEGDEVNGTTQGTGAYAEYLCMPETDTLALKPSNMMFGEAAACDGYLTALPFLRDAGHIQRGQKVLINGASGSVGSAAVQLAKYFGAEVTGVCSTGNVDLVKSLGAATVIDYTKEDFTRSGQTWDIIFDTVGKLSFSQCKRSLNPGGIFLETDISLSILRHMLWTSKAGDRKAKIEFTGLRPTSERAKDLAFMNGLIEAGTLKPVIDRIYPLEQMAEAHRYVETGHKKGNVVISVIRDTTG